MTRKAAAFPGAHARKCPAEPAGMRSRHSNPAGKLKISSKGNASLWDINPDGKRFLMMKEVGNTPSESTGHRKINVVLNWLDELKQRVPVT